MSVRASIPHAAVRALDEMARRRGLTRAQAMLRVIALCAEEDAIKKGWDENANVIHTDADNGGA